VMALSPLVNVAHGRLKHVLSAIAKPLRSDRTCVPPRYRTVQLIPTFLGSVDCPVVGACPPDTPTPAPLIETSRTAENYVRRSKMPSSPSRAVTTDWVLMLVACGLIVLGITTAFF
jgi:hypothetical protein